MQESGQREKRFDIPYYDGVNSTVQDSIAKKTELSHAENARAPKVGILEKREGQTVYGTNTSGSRFFADENYGLRAFKTTDTSQKGVFRISDSDEPTQTLTVDVYDQVFINEQYLEGTFSSPTYSVDGSTTTLQTFVIDNVTITEPSFLKMQEQDTVSVRNDYPAVDMYSLSSTGTWIKLSDTDAQSMIGSQFDFTVAEENLYFVNGKGLNRQLAKDGSTVITSDDTDDLYNSPPASKVAYYKSRLYLADFVRDGIRYPQTVARSSYPLGIVSLVDGDHAIGSNVVALTDTKFIYSDTGMNSYDVYRGGRYITNFDVLQVRETDVALVPTGVDQWNINSTNIIEHEDRFRLDEDPFVTTGISFSSDGLKMYILDLPTADQINEYSLSTAWDLSTMSETSNGFDYTTQDATVRGHMFSFDGKKMYLWGDTNDEIYQYTLATAWDVTTATYDTVSKDTNADFSTNDLIVWFMNDSGDRVYVFDNDGSVIKQYNLSTEKNISTASLQAASISLTNVKGISFSSDGTKMLVLRVAGSDGELNQYDLSTAWELSSASLTSAIDLPTTAAQTVRGMATNRARTVTGYPNSAGTYTDESDADGVFPTIELYVLDTQTDTSIRKYYIYGAPTALESSDEVWIAGTFNNEKQFRWVNNPTASGRDVKQYETFRLSGGDSEITLLEPIGDRLLIANRESMAAWDDYTLTHMDLGIGCTSTNGYVKLLGILYFLDYSGVYATNGQTPTLISRKVERYIKGTTKDGIENAAAGYKGLSVFFCIGDITLYNEDGSVDKILQDGCLEYHIAEQNWYVHTNVPITEFEHFISDDGVEHLLGTRDISSESVVDFLSGYTDDGEEIFFRADTQQLQLLKEIETHSAPLAVVTEVLRGAQMKCYISTDRSEFYELNGTVQKGVSILKVNSEDMLKTKPVLAKKIKISYRDSSRQRCRIAQAAIIYLPTTLDEVKE